MPMAVQYLAVVAGAQMTLQSGTDVRYGSRSSSERKEKKALKYGSNRSRSHADYGDGFS